MNPTVTHHPPFQATPEYWVMFWPAVTVPLLFASWERLIRFCDLHNLNPIVEG